MSGQRIQDHYARSGTGATIAARAIAAVRAHGGADMAITPETLAPVDHLHGRGCAGDPGTGRTAGTAVG